MKSALFALFALALSTSVMADSYLVDSRGDVVKNSYNQCVRTGSWTEGMTRPECDAVKVVETVTTTQAVPDVAKAAPVATKLSTSLSLSDEQLFDYNKSVLKADGKVELTKFAIRLMKFPNEVITVIGYTDRIGSDKYNLKLSQRRADVVKAYLIEQGATQRIEATGKGKADPVVSCDTVKGKANGKNKALIACLKDNRRTTLVAE